MRRCYLGTGIPYTSAQGTCKRDIALLLLTGYGPCHCDDA